MNKNKIEVADNCKHYCEEQGFKKVADSRHIRIFYQNEYNTDIVAVIVEKAQYKKMPEIELGFRYLGDDKKGFEFLEMLPQVKIEKEELRPMIRVLNRLGFKSVANGTIYYDTYEKNGVKVEIKETGSICMFSYNDVVKEETRDKLALLE